jgi:hypothetical protein
MRLSETTYDNSETGCCARLDSAQWDGRTFEWKDKPFLKDHIRAFLHVPLNFGSVISRDQAAIERAGAYPEQPIWLTDETSLWGSDVYVAVDREVPNAVIERLSGTFMTRVFEGPYRNLGRWIGEMKTHVARKGRRIAHLYFFYATCPKCARRFGKNQVVLFALLQNEAAMAA